MQPEPAADLLGTIVAATRRTVEARERRLPLSVLSRKAEAREPRPGVFRSALTEPDRMAVIAECKRRSPAKGVLRAGYEPAAIAAGYASAGAAAISVLTEPSFFDGSLEHLAAVREAVTIPILRKDFIVSEYQLLEARAVGADAVLLIVAALTAAELTDLLARADGLGLDVLVEVHSAEELAAAGGAGARLIGVNNRNLRTLSVDLGTSEALIAAMPAGAVAVSESGLKTADDLTRLRGLGYRAFLMGERFMTASDPGAALAHLLGEAEAPAGRGSRREAAHGTGPQRSALHMMVKICGITRAEDAAAAVALGASALGFVFWPGSPRAIDPHRARAIAASLPPFVTTVGVFVNQPASFVNSVSNLVGLGVVQLHGDEDPAFAGAVKRPVLKAVTLPADSASTARWSPRVMLLVDAHDPVRRGGTGATANWALAADLARHRPIVLAGGLTPDNVMDAVAWVQPLGIDVSSGVEHAPGIKDHHRMTALFEKLRAMASTGRAE